MHKYYFQHFLQAFSVIPKKFIGLCPINTSQNDIFSSFSDVVLIQASQRGYLEVVQLLLLDKGADLYVRNDEALKRTSQNRHYDIVKLLLEKGANLHADNGYALRWASFNGYFKVVPLLLEKGANLCANNDEAMKLASLSLFAKKCRLIRDTYLLFYSQWSF